MPPTRTPGGVPNFTGAFCRVNNNPTELGTYTYRWKVVLGSREEIERERGRGRGGKKENEQVMLSAAVCLQSLAA